MKKRTLILLPLLFVFTLFSRADEGMWLPFMLGRNYEDMKKHGLNLTQEQIYSVNNSSIKDAIIIFGGGCTGEMISKNGLILTNHHCGYDAIAAASTSAHNYLDNGFWAKKLSEEIPAAGVSATFIIRMEDVSATINKELNSSMTAEERAKKIAEISKVLEEDASKGTNYTAFVRDFYNGNEFYLFVKEVFTDVRLVGTAPQSAGKFGGDTDNWMWPRHTADFSMFRIYAGSDNKPAAYSAENKPYSPKHHLPISLKGVKENDFAMIMGFPGSTDRYLSSYGVDQAVSLQQPKIVDIRAEKLRIMKRYMDQDVDLRLKYSSKYAQVANYWKYFIGQTEQVKNNRVIDKKKLYEDRFKLFIQDKPEYQSVLSDMEAAYKVKSNYVYINAYQSEMIYSIDANLNALRYKLWIDALKENKNDVAANYLTRLLSLTDKYYANSTPALEAEVIERVFQMYIEDVPMDQMGEFTAKIAKGGNKSIAKFMKSAKSKSIFLNKSVYEKFKANPTVKAMEADPIYQLVQDVTAAHAAVGKQVDVQSADEKLDRADRLFMKGIREMDSERIFYPNANFTMRLTYGNVLPYEPKDGIKYNYKTTFEGVLQKEDASNPEFNVDPIMKQKYLDGDLGQYGENGALIVNFLTNNDITGGNSGSPVINADGHLIGSAFDGNWEAMSGDLAFEPNIQRTIAVDIRYILWIVDKCYGATNLIDEMTIVK